MVDTSNDVGSTASPSLKQPLPSWTQRSSSGTFIPSDLSVMSEELRPMPPNALPQISHSTTTDIPSEASTLGQYEADGVDPSDPNIPTPSTTWGSLSESPTCIASSTNDSYPNAGSSETQSIVQRVFDRSWIQPAIGLTTLLVTLIALFVYSHRSFVMAKWTEENDMLQACAQLIQVSFL